MALETIKKRVCDLCGSDDDVMRVRISLLNESTRTATVDVCAEHREPLVQVMGAKPSTGVRKRRQVTPKKEVKKRAKARA